MGGHLVHRRLDRDLHDPLKGRVHWNFLLDNLPHLRVRLARCEQCAVSGEADAKEMGAEDGGGPRRWR